MTDSSPTPLHLIPDAPITNSGYDRLDRMSFVRSFAEAIGAVKGIDSVVLALAGPWGSGKSSLLNLVALELDSSAAQPPLVMRFNPWWFSGSNRLVAAFLQQLGAAISRPTVKETLGTATTALDRLSVAVAKPGAGGLSEDPAARDIELIRNEIDSIFDARQTSSRVGGCLGPWLLLGVVAPAGTLSDGTWVVSAARSHHSRHSNYSAGPPGF